VSKYFPEEEKSIAVTDGPTPTGIGKEDSRFACLKV
jgi:hypothetical protein